MNTRHSDGALGRLRYQDLFAGLPTGAADVFNSLQVKTSYPRGATLFHEHQSADGIFVVRTGSVKLAESVEAGQSLRSRIAGPGEILGLPAALIACPYRAAAQLLEPSEIGFVDREKFSTFLCEHGVVSLQLVRLLSRALTSALDQVRVALARSPWKV
ncbi:MAG TPA: Crp/Fnr family transcriptional regulator [Terriglobia bacterium]|nr:Crp/Fnr family transcriptional regulator [Terriglobia bacterium]